MAKTPKKPTVRDSVLFFGMLLTVTGLEKKGESEVVSAEDIDGRRKRDEARAEMQKLREETRDVHLSRADWKPYDRRFAALDQRAREALCRVKLRTENLEWWEEKQCWTYSGGIMTDAQKAQAEKLLGKDAVRGARQREALLYLEARAGRN